MDGHGMSERLRLLAIIEATSITGPAKNLLEFAPLAREAGVDTTLCTYQRGTGSNAFLDRVRADGIPLEVVLEAGAFDRRVIGALREVAARVKPDVIQTHAVKSHFLARLAGLPGVAPWVAFHHGYTWTTKKARLYNELDRWSLRRADRVLTVSGPFREELVAKGVQRERIAVIHNAIHPSWGQAGREPEAARRLRAEWGIPDGVPVALIVGRLSLEKDHLSLLRALKRVREKQPLHLVIVGDGPERPLIEAAIRELGLRDGVTLTGQQRTAEPFYGIADLAVLASRTEGSPNALLEAMAAGVPAVATTVGGIPEIATDGETALLVPPGEAEALARALLRILEQDRSLTEAMTARAAERIRLRYTPSERVHRLVTIYRTLAGKNAGTPQA
jgi:glycosyltransferase involved in cell wall biosynthesis